MFNFLGIFYTDITAAVIFHISNNDSICPKLELVLVGGEMSQVKKYDVCLHKEVI